jgi:hypothetical protein
MLTTLTNDPGKEEVKQTQGVEREHRGYLEQDREGYRVGRPFLNRVGGDLRGVGSEG